MSELIYSRNFEDKETDDGFPILEATFLANPDPCDKDWVVRATLEVRQLVDSEHLPRTAVEADAYESLSFFLDALQAEVKQILHDQYSRQPQDTDLLDSQSES